MRDTRTESDRTITCSIILTASVVFSHRSLIPNSHLLSFIRCARTSPSVPVIARLEKPAHSHSRPLALTSALTLTHSVRWHFTFLCGRLTAHLLPFSTHPHPTALTLGGRSKGSQVLTLLSGIVGYSLVLIPYSVSLPLLPLPFAWITRYLHLGCVAPPGPKSASRVV